MTNVLILNVDAKKSLHFRLINTCSKADRFKLDYRKYSEEHSQLGINLLNLV